MIKEETQIRLMQAGFRLLRRDAQGGSWTIRYRTLDVIEPPKWRTLASYRDRSERDQVFFSLVDEDFWTIDIENDING